MKPMDKVKMSLKRKRAIAVLPEMNQRENHVEAVWSVKNHGAVTGVFGRPVWFALRWWMRGSQGQDLLFLACVPRGAGTCLHRFSRDLTACQGGDRAEELPVTTDRVEELRHTQPIWSTS